MSFPAKYPGTCKRCKQPIKVGQDIKAPTRQAFVHQGCISVLSPAEADAIKDLVDDLIDAGFTCVVEGVWERRDTEVSFHFTDDELVIVVWVAGFSLRVSYPGQVTPLCDALERHRDLPDVEEEDEFDVYRQKLLERYPQQ